MTRARYYLLRFGQAFGFQFKSRHANAAAMEAHLLQEAEEILGAFCWEQLENSKDLSVEYWSLRKLTKEYQTHGAQMARAQEFLADSNNERAGQLEEVLEKTRLLVKGRDSLIERCDRLNAEREVVLGDARIIKRRYDGTKAKLEVLTEEGKTGHEEFALTRNELLAYKKKFKQLRDRRDELAQKIDELDNEIDEFDQKIRKRRDEINEESLGGFGRVGKANRDITQARSKTGLLEQEMNEIFCTIGKQIVLNQNDPEYEELVREHRNLIGQIKILRNSVEMNHTLSGR